MRRAFTLIELLVVVAIIAVLIAILLPSLGKAKENARKTICASQLKGQGTSMAVYAAQNSDQLPAGPLYDDSVNTATWLHDETVAFSDTLLNVQTSANMSALSMRKWFYCPSNQQYNLDAYWKPTGPAGTNRRLGYTYINYRNIPPANLNSSVQPTTLKRSNPPLDWRRKLNSTPYASRAELVEDLIMNANIPTSPAINYQDSTNSSTGVFLNSVSHMGTRTPAGSNILFCDGHAEWIRWPGASKVHWLSCGGGPSGTTNFMLLDP